MRYGYVRVSTKDQCVDRQLIALHDAGVTTDCIFIDRESGKDFNRKNYRRLMRTIARDDELFIKSIDRLGRNYEEIIAQWNTITRVKETHIVVLDCPLLDTRQHVHGLTGRFIADLVLQILSYVAQVERENIKARQAEGIRAAKQKGVVFGRPCLSLPDNFLLVAHLWQHGEVNLRQGAQMLSVSHGTFAKWLRGQNITKLV